MTSSSPLDVSLYELAISSEPQPQPLQISPTTFKSLISTVIDLLIEQQIPATVWLKLPKGEIWQAELERLHRSAVAPYTIYNLQTHQESQPNQLHSALNGTNGNRDCSEKSGLHSRRELSTDWLYSAVSPQPLALIPEKEPAPTSNSTIHTISLAAESQLKREFFLLVASAHFCGLVLGHRPRSGRPRSDSAPPEISLPLPSKQNQLLEENLEHKHPLLGVCSFEPSLLQRVLQGINQAICVGQLAHSSAAIEPILVNWDDLLAQGVATTLSPLILAHLFTKQVQRQEEVWRNSLSHRKHAEQAAILRQQNEDLLTALRLKDEFVQTVGQELRTPLTTMKTALSLLSSPHIKPPQRQRYMDMISQECDRQSSLITGVLELVQLENSIAQMPMEPLRLADIVPGVVSTYQPLAQEKGVRLGYMIPEELPPVSCVNQWLRQIVINLLHNSIKFTQSGGQVWVRAKQQGDSIQIEFRDTGVGIAQADIPKIFDRFYRVRGTGEDTSGAGLGLSIVQQLLLRSGGSVSVKSKLGEGSIFSVVLPVYVHPANTQGVSPANGKVRER
jgi:signal transduction histidine kinase